jgi:hypothetical protein
MVLVLVEKYRRPGMNSLHTMQTNGMLLSSVTAGCSRHPVRSHCLRRHPGLA